MEFNNYHIPVLLDEVINALNLKPEQTVVDATFGGGGHSREIAKKIGNGTLVCIDQDREALANGGIRGVRTELVHDNFSNINGVLKDLGIDKVDAILADLGVSNHQIDTPERGFSYTKDAPLDMRMDMGQQRTAWHVVNQYKTENLERIIRDYGEERYAKRISEAITKARPIETTLQLAKVIQNAVPGNYYQTGGHPAKRTFQAIRIAVNDELAILEKFVKDATNCLKPKGRLAIITFHSLEDRIVKQTMKHLATECICPPKTPKCICNHHATLKILTKKPTEATETEQKANPRSQSAKLRTAEKI